MLHTALVQVTANSRPSYVCVFSIFSSSFVIHLIKSVPVQQRSVRSCFIFNAMLFGVAPAFVYKKDQY